MFVTAIIPTFNRAALLAETVAAVRSQSRAPDEIVIVDDGSTDGTLALLDEIGDGLQIISKPNTGKADSLNMALSRASGTHIWIVDDDDLPRTDGLANLVALLEEQTGSEIAYGRHERFIIDRSTGARHTMETGYWDDRSADWFLIATLEDFFVHQPAMLVAKGLYDRAGPFNVEMVASEDYEMLIRLAQLGRVAATDAVIFDQRVHDGVRGQIGHQFAASERNAKWIEYDQRILASVNAAPVGR
ncbi:MAG: glycosyltransferase [Pseudomonadota bacterium]